LDSSLHPPFVVFVTEVIGYELICQIVNNCVWFA
jgi:hypothetical protein